MTRIGGLKEDSRLAQALKKQMEQWLVASNLDTLQGTIKKRPLNTPQVAKTQ